ncbi:hypothetical protein UFOVP1290_435 [uncultured Caudovirales phage]|uniref:Uncharacterized protein n=1 Tax=uncultured Caudovirales phage TaxID=2100421 RepID=A0A6J5RXE3_9CAUD|nr:hypothetical protein UFOVP1290_435 [uncultured Caudovirales phage]
MVPKKRTYNNSEILTGQCIACNAIKPIEDFPISQSCKDKLYYRNRCKICFLNFRKEYRKKNSHQDKNYKNKNKDKILEYNKNYYKKNKDKCDLSNMKNYLKYKKCGKTKQYSTKYISLNKIKINEKARNLYRIKRKTDINFKLASNISRSIRYQLKLNSSSKMNESCKKYLQYSIQELKEHLEKQFEPWMNWNNHGCYMVKSWVDNDQSTWKWQIDHIIPQSTFKYTSMEDEDFKKCWSLDNLRPYSAKQNVIDGYRRYFTI